MSNAFQHEKFVGFIRHSPNIPITIRKLKWREQWHLRRLALSDSATGVVVHHPDSNIRIGTLVEITLPCFTGYDTESFYCRVSLLRHLEEGCELGLCPLTQNAAHRVRMMEQMCHIESWVRERSRKEGPYVSRERLVEEWIGKYANEFPN